MIFYLGFLAGCIIGPFVGYFVLIWWDRRGNRS